MLHTLFSDMMLVFTILTVGKCTTEQDFVERLLYTCKRFNLGTEWRGVGNIT